MLAVLIVESVVYVGLALAFGWIPAVFISVGLSLLLVMFGKG